jgi:predicted nucleic acid-binding protein
VKLVLDTSVWVEHLRTGALVELMPVLRTRFTLRLDSVTLAELIAGCRSKRERRVVERLAAPFERAGRILNPLEGDFVRAATALSRLREAGRSLKNPGAALLDGLIAAVCVREGALLVTSNLADFRLLALEMPLGMEAFAGFRNRLVAAGTR